MLTQVRSQTADFVYDTMIRNFSLASWGKSALEAALEVPKKLEHGHLAFPVFPLAKELKKAPPLIAKELSDLLTNSKDAFRERAIVSVLPAGGFVNVTFKDEFLQDVLLAAVKDEAVIGKSKLGAGKKLVIDYVSPNVAKPMHIGHLRATVIGQSIRNLAATQGYDVVGLNHLGDWGVQFGKLAWAFFEWGHEYDFDKEPFESLFAIYVRFHDEAEKNPELDAKGSQVFKQLEEGDEKVTALWKRFIDISLKEYDRLLGLLGVKHDLIRGESFYNDRLAKVEKMLADKGLLEESEGAMIVRLGDEMPPCLIRKADGASLYATRDLASAIYRHEELKADINLYVVGAEQSLHFKQVFKVLELMGYEWAKNCHHISFGAYRFPEGKMSTRRGRTIFFEDVVDQGIAMIEKVIEQKNPDLADKRTIAEQVGVGAIIFNDLAIDRVRDVEFNWEKALSFEGDSGPYVQYTHVRCLSLVRKYGKPAPNTFAKTLTETEERELVRLLLGYQDVLAASFATFRPNIVAQYLLEVCGAFSRFYNKHRILGEAPEVESSRMALVEATRRILAAGLKTLNIQAPQAM